MLYIIIIMLQFSTKNIIIEVHETLFLSLQPKPKQIHTLIHSAEWKFWVNEWISYAPLHALPWEEGEPCFYLFNMKCKVSTTTTHTERTYLFIQSQPTLQQHNSAVSDSSIWIGIGFFLLFSTVFLIPIPLPVCVMRFRMIRICNFFSSSFQSTPLSCTLL